MGRRREYFGSTDETCELYIAHYGCIVLELYGGCAPSRTQIVCVVLSRITETVVSKQLNHHCRRFDHLAESKNAMVEKRCSPMVTVDVSNTMKLDRYVIDVEDAEETVDQTQPLAPPRKHSADP